MLLRFLALLLCCAGTLSLSACKDKPTTAQLLEMAAQASAADDHITAVIHYKSVLQQDPYNVHLRVLLGKEYLELDEPVYAEKEFRRAIEMGAPLKEANPLLLRALLEQRAFDPLIEQTQAQAVAHTLDPLAQTYRGMAFLSKGQVDEAQALFASALTADPKLAPARLGQARVAFVRGQEAQALEQVNAVLKEQPQLPEALSTKADLHALLNQRDEAIAAFQALLAVKPKSIVSYSRLVTMLSEAKRFDEAHKAVDALAKIDARNGLVDYLGALILYHQGDLKKAREQLQGAVREMPGFAQAHVLAGRIELADKRPDEAIKALSLATQLAPNDVPARYLLAQALLQERQPQQAFETLRPLLYMYQRSPQLFELAGTALLQSNDLKLANAYLEYAARLDPKRDSTRRTLAMSRLLNQWDRGDLPTVSNNSDADPALKFSRRMFEVVQALMSAQPGAAEKAGSLATQLVHDYPTHAVAHNVQGTALVRLNKRTEARAAFEEALHQEPDYYPALLNLSQMDLDEGKRDAALKRFEDRLAKQPDQLDALLGRAEIAVRAGEPGEKIVAWLEKAQQTHPQILKPAVLLARQYLQMGNTARALQAVERAQQIAPNDADVAELMGRAQVANGNRTAALTAFAQLVSQRPNSVEALLLFARAQLADGKNASAVQSLSKALLINPQASDARIELILLYASTGQMAEAQNQLTQLKEHKASPLQVAEVEGDMAYAAGQTKLAIERYRKLQQTAPNPIMLRKLHSALIGDGQIDEAFVLGLDWLKQQPKDLATMNYLAASAAQQKRDRIAAQLYAALLAERPKDASLLNNLAMATTSFDPARAITLAQQAQQLAPDNPAIMDTLGWIQVSQAASTEQVRTGLNWLDQARVKAPDDLDIAYHYAMALLKSGDRLAARMALSDLLAQNKHFAEEEEARGLLNTLGR
ncbi:MAG: PEP-CTERM system TPR-repeat protein PrsT [Burkholderiaceae bacterium]|nr:MAG: PEP-CTERM system TPR-repeat protein PrsT [Burkholderiaceae bacterium]